MILLWFVVACHLIVAIKGDYETSISASSPQCDNVTITEHEIAVKIFANHTQWVRPVKNARRPIDVSIRLVISAINDVNERERYVKLNGYLTVKWVDELHTWDDALPYACLDSLTIPTTEVWLPEVATINSESHYDLILSKNVERIRLYSNGMVSYRPGGTFSIFCEFNLVYFPFDTQTCLLQLESWRYTRAFQTLTISSPPVTFRYWIENEQWQVIDTDARSVKTQYVNPENVFDHIEFEFTIRRKVGFYMMNVIIPSLIISIAQMAVFTLPVHEVMKIHVSFTCLLAYGVFQLMIIADMPRTSDHIPLLSIYIDLSMAYIAGAMLFEGLVFICLRKADDKERHQPVAGWMYSTASFVGQILRVYKSITLLTDDENQRQTTSLAADGVGLFQGCRVYSHRLNSQLLTSIFRSSSGNVGENDSNSALAKRRGAIYPRGSTSLQSISMIGFDHYRTIGQNQTSPQNNNNENKESPPSLSAINQAKWRFLAEVIDRFTMVVYFLLILTTAIGMFGILPNTIDNQNKSKEN